MKIFTTVLLLVIFNSSFAQTNYCIPNPPNGIDGYSIDSVKLESLDTAFSGITYQFIRDSVHHETCYLTPGSNYKIYLKSGTQAVSTLGAWIDWNNDTTLSSSEKLGEINTTAPNEVDFISFTVPANCFKGKLRLRVRNSNSSSLNACNDYLSGQILDFTITTINPFYQHNFYAGWEFSGTDSNYIDGVSIGTIDNQNTGGVNGPVYGDYSYLVTDLTACNSYYLRLNCNFPVSGDSVVAFIDYNKNGTFNSYEYIGRLDFPVGISTDSILINPINISGNVRLRIICYSGTVISEVEDYTLNLATSSATVFPTATIGSDLILNCDTACYYRACQGQITFHDYGCGQPTVRLWSVPGATPSTSSAKNPVFTFPNSGFYNITLIDSNSLGSDTAHSRIYINPPDTIFSLGNDTTICTNSSLLLSAPAEGPSDCFTYLWSTGATSRQITINSTGTFFVHVNSCTTGGCPSSDSIAVNFSPRIYNVTGGGANCGGAASFDVSLSNSESGINYQLRLNGNPVGAPLPGTGSALGFGLQSAAGAYTVTATNAILSCTATMNGSATITIGQPPVIFNISGGGSFCASGNGLPVFLDSSVATCRYQLIRNGISIGASVTGTGDTITFPDHNAGNYTVISTDIASGCTSTMNGIVNINALPSPTVYNISGGGTFCGGTSQTSVVLNDSQLGVIYKLRRNGVLTGDSLTGTGFSISFSYLMLTGNYTVVASDTSACTSIMNGSANFTIINTPVQFHLTGGGIFCEGDSIGNILLDSSQSGVRYQLYLDSNYVGNSLNGNGSPLNFGNQTAPGTYFVIGSNTITACRLPMLGTPTLVVNPQPEVYNVTGGGHFCSGGTGAEVGLSNSDTMFYYQLYRNNIPVGLLVQGTDSAFDFGPQLNSGVYTVVAHGIGTTCSDTMNGSATLVLDSFPHPQITSVIPDTVCIFHSAIALSGTPLGGLFFGNGVLHDTLFPNIAGVGITVIYYDYTDTVTGCSSFDQDSIVVDPCIGIDEIDFPGTISVFPNPANNEITADFFLQKETDVSINIINGIGQVIFGDKLSKVSGSFKYLINTSKFSDGVYLLRFSMSKVVVAKRILVQHD